MMNSTIALIFLGALTVASAKSLPLLLAPLDVINDKYYVTNITVGSSHQVFSVGVSTGLHTTFIPSIRCKSCIGHNLFDERKSTTLKLTDNVEVMALATTQVIKVEGLLAFDMFGVAGVSVNNQSFLDVVMEDGYDFPMDGMISLDLTKDNLISNMYSHGIINAPVLGHYISADSGELSFGGPNPIHYAGQIHYFNMDPTQPWYIDNVNYKITSKSSSLDSDHATYSYMAFFDPSIETIQLGNETSYTVHTALGATLKNGFWTFDCSILDEYPTFTFMFSGQPFVMEPQDYVSHQNGTCLSRFGTEAYFDFETEFLIGQPFFEKYYTVFDFGNQLIGFAISK